MKYSPDEHDGRAPESETPEVDAVIYNIFSLARVARSLERRLSLAQTEIKEHMRIEDELRAENVKLSAKRSDEMLERGSLHMTQMQEQLTEAQSRIAELEKVLGRWLTGPHVINAPLSLINETKYAALKARA